MSKDFRGAKNCSYILVLFRSKVSNGSYKLSVMRFSEATWWRQVWTLAADVWYCYCCCWCMHADRLDSCQHVCNVIAITMPYRRTRRHSLFLQPSLVNNARTTVSSHSFTSRRRVWKKPAEKLLARLNIMYHCRFYYHNNLMKWKLCSQSITRQFFCWIFATTSLPDYRSNTADELQCIKSPVTVETSHRY